MNRTLLLLTVILLLVSLGSGAQEQDRLYLDITLPNPAINTGSPTIHNLSISPGTTTSSLYPAEENYTILLQNPSGQPVLNESIPVSFTKYVHTYPPTPPETASSVRKELYLPLPLAADRLVIQHDGTTVQEADLPSALCTVDDTCPAYCAGRGIDADCQQQMGRLPLLITGLGALLVLAAFGYRYRTAA